eukprot:comp12806_c0_seq1/m.7946 comp12806_c0_seq1/g.7946  ORF comp12806_c0_seq1/g.7946 comp12806_c0_seq1/m.7946 type:complete len:349 (-) comp12806_c0_seq1:141-1187(-)
MAPTEAKHVVVLGAGIVGVSTAIRLREAGYRVTLWTKDTYPGVTSAGCGGFWCPYHIEPEDKVEPWCRETLEVMREHAMDEESGVTCMPTVQMYTKETEENLPWWKDITELEVQEPGSKWVPEGYSSAWVYQTAVADMDVYMKWLRAKLDKLGIPIVEGKELTPPFQSAVVNAKEVLKGDLWVLVNCTGLGANKLLGDDLIKPGRGVVLKVKRPIGFNYVLCDDTRAPDIRYIIPRGKHLATCGGCYQEGNWNEEVMPGEAERIKECVAEMAGSIEGEKMKKAFQDAEVTATWSGLRPVRDPIRLEIDRDFEADGDVHVVHNYGHGGAGVTACWGCATEVCQLLAGLE